jgi:hypothetical protein
MLIKDFNWSIAGAVHCSLINRKTTKRHFGFIGMAYCNNFHNCIKKKGMGIYFFLNKAVNFPPENNRQETPPQPGIL